MSDAQSVLMVCSRCRRSEPEEDLNGVRSGQLLLAEVLHQAAGTNLRVQPVACMSGCKRACAVGLMAPNKVGYLFGDLPPDELAAKQTVELALRHARTEDGYVRRADRPILLQSGIIARLPPLNWMVDGEISWPA